MSQMLEALRTLESRGVCWKTEHVLVPAPHFALPMSKANDTVTSRVDTPPATRTTPSDQIVIVDEVVRSVEEVATAQIDLAETRVPQLFVPSDDVSREIHESDADQWIAQQLADPICCGEYSQFAAQLLAVSRSEPKPVVSMFGCGSRNAGAPAAMLTAASLTANGTRKVLLIDTDSVERQTTHLFELNGQDGLAEVLAGTSSAESVLVESASPGLWVVPYGSPRRQAENQPWGTLNQAFDDWLERHEFIILSGGRTPSSKAISIASSIGYAILVVELGSADVQPTIARRDHLLRSGVRLSGSLVLGASRTE